MTEAQWLNCADPIPMLRHLRAGDSRKVLLLTCACVQLSGKRDRHALQEWVALAADVADGLRPRRQLQQYEIEHDLGYGIRSWALGYVFEAAWQLPRDEWDSDWAKKHRPTEVRTQAAQAALVREVFGNPFRRPRIRTAWRTPKLTALARRIYQNEAFDRMPELADALERRGCKDSTILAHCRNRREHVRGCWVIDQILGKK
jgi:hypothetical protein